VLQPPLGRTLKFDQFEEKKLYPLLQIINAKNATKGIPELF